MGRGPPAEGTRPELRALVASAPGKAILMGEHAVVYGEPALVAAVDLRLRARFEPLGSGSPGRRTGPDAPVEIALPPLGWEARLPWSEVDAYARAARERWEAYAAAPGEASFAPLRGGDPAHLVKVALGEAGASLGEEGGRALRVVVDSELAVGSGLGSSAALALAVAGGYLAWRGRPADPSRLEALAGEVERRQHGLPSGADAAAALRGGVVWAERDPSGALRFRALAVPPERLRRFRVFDTGSPAESTGEVVAAVRARVGREPELRGVLRRMGETTRRFRDALVGTAGGAETVDLVRRFERQLEALGVVPEPARRLVRAVEERGGAAKVSGAGALTPGRGGRPGAGSLLVHHPEPDRIDGWEFLGEGRGPSALGGEGFRIESPREG